MGRQVMGKFKDYHFKRSGAYLIQKKTWSFAFQFHYASHYRYFGNTSFKMNPEYVNCIEFVQRVLYELKSPCCNLLKLQLHKKLTLYTAFLPFSNSTHIPFES